MKRILAFIVLMGSVLIMQAQPVITQQPEDELACVDSCATFSVSAVGVGLTYSWFATDGAMDTLIGSGSAIELCDSILAWDAFAFYCVVFDGNGDSVYSDSALLTVDSCLAPIADFSYTWNHTNICFENKSIGATTIIWLFGDGSTNSSNVQNPCHDYATKEIYYVKLRAFNDYGEDVKERKIDLIGVEDELRTSFKVYPNPTSDHLFIQSEQLIEMWTLIDARGSVVQQATPNSNKIEIDTRTLDKGVYTISIQQNGKVFQEKIVKQ